MPRAILISEASRQWANNLNDLRDRWNIRHEISTEQEWMPVLEFQKSLENLSRSDLLDLKVRLLDISQAIKKRLGNAKSRAYYGKYSDPGWYRESEQAERSVSNHIQAVNHALSNIKIKRALGVEAQFVENARRMLPEKQFEEIMAAANRAVYGPKKNSK